MTPRPRNDMTARRIMWAAFSGVDLICACVAPHGRLFFFVASLVFLYAAIAVKE